MNPRDLKKENGSSSAVTIRRPLIEGVSLIKTLKQIGLVLAAILFVSLNDRAFAAKPSGGLEYQDNCARCHGPDAKGNGPDANEKPGYHPADLTQISKHNGGHFPRQKIYDVIDGGKRVPGHYNFNSPMPLWGLNFQLTGKEYSAESEAAVQGRINALVDYLRSIQEK
jgi:mono/diheme cytochrome c family protein